MLSKAWNNGFQILLIVLWTLVGLTLSFEWTEEKLNDINKEVLLLHNQIRAVHGMPDLKINQELVSQAHKALEYFTKRGKWLRKHMKYNNQPVGRNFARFMNINDISGILGLFQNHFNTNKKNKNNW